MIGFIAVSLLTVSPAAHTWQDIVQPAFKDCTFTVRAVEADQGELRKISRDFATSYRLLGNDVKAEMKEPFMLRLESNVEGTRILYIVNGGKKAYKVPKIRIASKEDVSHKPGKRQTVLDFGLLTPSLFESLFDANFVRDDRESGDLVFDLTYKHPEFDDTSRQRVWVDPQKRYITKRVWFAQDGHEMATFVYEDPKLLSGVWFPTKAVVKNIDRKVAGVTEYTQMAINVGLSEDPFKL